MGKNMIEDIGRKYSIAILKALSEEKTAKEISNTHDIPIATCYRRIEQLEKSGLVEETNKKVTEKRKEEQLYMRSIDEIKIYFTEDKIDIETTENEDIEKDLDEVWRELSK